MYLRYWDHCCSFLKHHLPHQRQQHLFYHGSDSGKPVAPLLWGSTYSYGTRSFSASTGISAANRSRLCSLIASGGSGINCGPGTRLVPRVSLNGMVEIYIDPILAGGRVVKIDKLTLHVDLEFQKRPSTSNLVYLEIVPAIIDDVDSGFIPYVRVSQKDLSIRHRSDGRGPISRAYSTGDDISIQMPRHYENYEFYKWEGPCLASQTTTTSEGTVHCKIIVDARFPRIRGLYKQRK